MPSKPRISRFAGWFRVMAACATILLIPACNQPRTSDKNLAFVDPAAGEAIVRETRTGVLGLGEAKSGAWVDCRPIKDFNERHIPGAISLPYELVTERHRELAGFGAIVVYADTYNDPRAIGMAKRLIELGYGQVYTLQGGLQAWLKSDRPVGGAKKNEPAR